MLSIFDKLLVPSNNFHYVNVIFYPFVLNVGVLLSTLQNYISNFHNPFLTIPEFWRSVSSTSEITQDIVTCHFSSYLALAPIIIKQSWWLRRWILGNVQRGIQQWCQMDQEKEWKGVNRSDFTNMLTTGSWFVNTTWQLSTWYGWGLKVTIRFESVSKKLGSA